MPPTSAPAVAPTDWRSDQVDTEVASLRSSCGCSNADLKKQVDDAQAALDVIRAARARDSTLELAKLAEKQADEAEALEWLRLRNRTEGNAIGRAPRTVGAVSKAGMAAAVREN